MKLTEPHARSCLRAYHTAATAFFFQTQPPALQEDLDAVLELVAAALHDVLHAEFAFVFVVDSPRKELWTTFRTPSSQEPLMAR